MERLSRVTLGRLHKKSTRVVNWPHYAFHVLDRGNSDAVVVAVSG
jgi:hypothetical protein